MAHLPVLTGPSKTVEAIYKSYESKNLPRFGRRLGASQIGNECPRRTWYAFRWAKQESFDGRMLRLFNTGHREEPRFVDDLRSIGCEVWDVDEATGRQWEYSAVSGHVVAKLDAVATGLPEAPKAAHDCEFKTHSAKSFGSLAKLGLKRAKPEHFAQLVVGMAMAELPRGLYLAVNKDTDELYAERVRWEEVKDEAARLLSYAETLVKSERAPERIKSDRESIPCKWCPFSDVCHGSEAPNPAIPAVVSCRSCVHSTPVIETNGSGRWRCERHRKTLAQRDQEVACKDHVWIPDFVAFAEVVDGGDGESGAWVEYRSKSSGAVWKNANDGHHYRSAELTNLPVPLVGLGTVDETKKYLPGEVVEVVNE